MLLNSKKYRWIVGVLLSALLSSCSFQELHQAQSIVAQADSLRQAGQMYGIDAGDSATLAQAYETLSAFNSPLLSTLNPQLSTIFSHACYHYGRLLREKENPVEAMQVFIDATLSHTHDYHILGRVYSNMGDICHLASEFPLSYDMFEHSADCFMQSGDSMLYYYGLNNMAFELAEQGKKEEAQTLLALLAKKCFVKDVLTKTLETKAVACLYVQQYDSAVYYAKRMVAEGNHEPTGYLVCAQAYSKAGIKDSAVYYAQHVLQISRNLFHQNNALYILTNDVPENQDVRSVASDRSDIQKQIEIRHGKLTQAVQLLSQELSRKPDLRWLYSIIVTLVIVGICLILYVYRKYQKKQLLTQKIEVLEHTATTMQKNNDNLKEQQDRRYAERLKQIQFDCEWFIKSNDIQNLLQKEDYNKVCELVNIHFSMLADKLKMRGRLNEKDICLCIYVMDGSLTDKQIADILYYSHNTIRSIKRYVAKKMGTTSAYLQSFLLKIAIE